jgi:hypothetical protein
MFGSCEVLKHQGRPIPGASESFVQPIKYGFCGFFLSKVSNPYQFTNASEEGAPKQESLLRGSKNVLKAIS